MGISRTMAAIENNFVMTSFSKGNHSGVVIQMAMAGSQILMYAICFLVPHNFLNYFVCIQSSEKLKIA